MLFFCPNIWSVLKKVVILQCQKGQRRGQKLNRNQRQNIALWCNGSTPDSGSVCESSSLSKATLKPIRQPDRFSYYIAIRIRMPVPERGSADFSGGWGRCQEYSLASLNMKNFISPTPRNWVLKALILALKDSAEAFVSLRSK